VEARGKVNVKGKRKGVVEMGADSNAKKSSGLSLLVAWTIVGVPLAWGVYNTLLNSMKLFQ